MPRAPQVNIYETDTTVCPTEDKEKLQARSRRMILAHVEARISAHISALTARCLRPRRSPAI